MKSSGSALDNGCSFCVVLVFEVASISFRSK